MRLNSFHRRRKSSTSNGTTTAAHHAHTQSHTQSHAHDRDNHDDGQHSSLASLSPPSPEYPSLSHLTLPKHYHTHSHQRTNTAPDAPALLRLPSANSSHSQGGASVSASSTRSRRATATSPSTPTFLTPSQPSSSSATSPSYFSPQPAASAPGKEPRSPGNRRPPAWNTSGIDNSRGPPITLITRGTPADASRRQQKPSRPADFAFAQQQLLQSGLVSPGAPSPRSLTGSRSRRGSACSVDSTSHTQTNTHTPHISRRNSTTTTTTTRAPPPPPTQPESHMSSSADDYSEYNSGMRRHYEDPNMGHRAGATDTSGTDGEQGEDLFLNIASDASREQALRSERLRSRLARPSNRQSFPSSSPAQSNSTTPQASRLPSAIDTKASTQYRRASAFSTTPRSAREQSPMSPATNFQTPQPQQNNLSPKRSFSTKRDSELSPHQFLSQFSSSRRRPSQPDATQTPPNRTGTYRPSNLHYSTPRANTETSSHVDGRNETSSRVDGTESLDSTGPATSVWDELDELKTRIRRIELGGKIPATSGAAVASATERPRTANTSVTTVSSSPKQQRKTNNESPAESTISTNTPQRAHPLLRDALAKARQHVAPAVYRSLEATATEALALAELTGSAGPQGNLQTVSSVLHGALVPDRQIRRKADTLCRNLTELCIELCDTKSSIASPAIRSLGGPPSRRPSVQINGDSPSIRPSIEPESDTIRTSPSRAMSRIEARRTSLMAGNMNGSPRESSHEPGTPSQSAIPRAGRAGTSLHRSRRNADEDDEDLTLRIPSRAMTDFRDVRSASNHTKRFSREYTSREPMPDLQPSPALQHTTSTRRPTVSGAENNSLLYQDNSPRFNIERRRTPGAEKQLSADLGSRLAQPSTNYSSHRASMGTTGLGRSGSLNRRFRSGVGE